MLWHVNKCKKMAKLFRDSEEWIMIKYAPGMRAIIRDEEWMIKKITINSMNVETLHCVGISTLVKDKEAIFLEDLEDIKIVDPSKVKLVADDSPFFRRTQLYVESQWRQRIPTSRSFPT